jgi:FkbM family methyltransferase
VGRRRQCRAYSLIAATAGVSSVVAVEPSSSNYAALCDNIDLNGFGGEIVPLPVALGAVTGLVPLEHADRLPGATHRVGVEGGRPVLAFALDDLLDRFELPAPTLLKLDVDGLEAAVLAGAERTIRRSSLRSLLVEVETAGESGVLERVEAAGLRLRCRFDTRDGVPLRGIWYGIFERDPA